MPLKADSRPPNNPVIALLGAPGTGKTTLAVRFPKPYVIDCDKNLAGPFNWLKQNKPKHLENVTYDQVAIEEDPKNPGQFIEVPVLQRHPRFMKLLSAAYKSDAETIIIDSATSLSMMLVQHVNKTCGLVENAKWEFEQWRLYLYAWTSLVTQIRDRVKTTILIVHEELEKNELDGTVRNVMLIPGQAKSAIPALVTDVWRLWILKKLTGTGASYHRMCTTVQDKKYINLKASIACPAEFELTDENLNKILKDAKLTS